MSIGLGARLAPPRGWLNEPIGGSIWRNELIWKNAMKSTNSLAASRLGAEPATVWRNIPTKGSCGACRRESLAGRHTGRNSPGPSASCRQNKPTAGVHRLDARRHQGRAPGGAPARLDADE